VYMYIDIYTHIYTCIYRRPPPISIATHLASYGAAAQKVFQSGYCTRGICVYIYVYKCVRIIMCIYIFEYVCIYIITHIYMYIHIYVCIYMNTCRTRYCTKGICTHIHINIIYMYVCMYIYVHLRTDICTSFSNKNCTRNICTYINLYYNCIYILYIHI